MANGDSNMVTWVLSKGASPESQTQIVQSRSWAQQHLLHNRASLSILFLCLCLCSYNSDSITTVICHRQHHLW